MAAAPSPPCSWKRTSAAPAAGDQLLTLFEIKGRVSTLIGDLERLGSYVHIPRADRDYAISVGLRMLTLRHLVIEAHPTDCELICFARKRNLGAQLRQNNTTGKSVKTCPAIRAKIFRLTCRANQRHNSARLTQLRGGSRSSRTCGEMRWT